MDSFYKKLSKRIKVMREETGFSQEVLAEKMGISRVAISQIEGGDRKISAEEIAKLSRIFNTPTDILLNLGNDIEVIFEKTIKQTLKPKEEAAIRKVMIEPHEYADWPPALKLFYMFLAEKGYIKDPERITEMIDEIEPHFIEILRNRFS